jgi:hypothetical protein
MSLEQAFNAGQTLADFLESSGEHAPLWQAVMRRTVVADDVVAAVSELGGRWHLLVLLEDWCGDAVNSVPVIARLAEFAPNLELRVLSRDAYPELMTTHLSPSGGRAIPVVILLDDAFVEQGWWGSRPRALQQWIDAQGAALGKEDRYLAARRWYVADRGASTAREIAELVTAAAHVRAAPSC